MAEVFLCEQGQLDDRSKRDLRKAGIVVVEVADVTRCQFVRSSEAVGSDDMLWACLEALNSSKYSGADDQRERLASNLFSVVVHSRKQAGQFVGKDVPAK